jgi:phage FluMu protein Com
MPIEFRCTSCGKLLRTGDDTAGKQAKCPACGEVVTIPHPASTSAEFTPLPPESGEQQSPFGAVPPPSGKQQSPFGAVPPPSGPPAPDESSSFDSENPYESPADYTMEPRFGAVEAADIVPTRINLSDVVNDGWAIFREQWGMCLLVVFIVWVINVVFGQVMNGVATGVAMVANDLAAIIIAQFVVFVATQLFSMWLSLGLIIYFLKVARGRDASLGDVFTGGRYVLTTVCATILFYLIIFAVPAMCLAPTGIMYLLGGAEETVIVLFVVGILIAAVPAIVLLLMFSPYAFLIVDRNAGIIESLALSKEITTGNKLTMFVLGILAVLIVMAGMLVCCVGMLVSAAYIMVLWSVTYLAMSGQPSALAEGMDPA